MAKAPEPPGSRPRAGNGEAGPPESAAEALDRARRHARQAGSEALAALQALLDALALSAGGSSARRQPGLRSLSRLIEGLAAELDPARGSVPRALLAAVAEALDAEIARWELRAREDAEARAVLRAFLGVRELLWEFGVRPEGSAAPRARRAAARRSRRPRVQRVPVEG